MSGSDNEFSGFHLDNLERLPYNIFDDQGRKINPAPWDKTPEERAASPYQEEPDDLGLEDELREPAP